LDRIEKIAWFASWPDSPDKVKQMLDNSVLLKQHGWDVGVITQYPQLQNLDFSSFDHVIFDNTNEMHFSETRSFRYGFKRIMPSCSELKQQCGDITFVDNKIRAPHVYSVYRLYAISMHYSSGFDYKVYAYFEGDFNGTEKLCKAIDGEARDIAEKDLNFVGFDSYNQEGSINACLFLGKTKLLSHYFPIFSVKTAEEYYRHYQNESVEDYLKRIFGNDPNSRIYQKSVIKSFLGEYGIDWDTSHAGFNWLEEVSPRVLASFTTNAPFLKSKENGYSLLYLFKQQFIKSDVYFHAKLTLYSDGAREIIFEKEVSLAYDHYFFFNEFFEIKNSDQGSIQVETTTNCGQSTIKENYEIKLDFQELAGYHRIRHIE
jgi:hypothetical protein